MPVPDLAAIAAVVRDAAAMAYARWQGEFTHWEKLPGDLVSEVDHAVNDQLRIGLSALDPSAAWLSEESALDAGWASAARCWVVDPIDGTRDFIRRRDGWCVSVALIVDGVIVAGVLDAPARGEVWSAAKRQGATLNGARVTASTRTTLVGARVPSPKLPREDADLVAVAQPNSIALRIAMVAAARADLVASARSSHLWDIAAAALIATEAGAVVSDATGAPLPLDERQARVTGVVACAPALHAPVLARLGNRIKVG